MICLFVLITTQQKEQHQCVDVCRLHWGSGARVTSVDIPEELLHELVAPSSMFSNFLSSISLSQPPAGPALKSANRIFRLLTGDTQLVEISQNTTPAIEGEIEFKNVSFVYPARPDAPVLDNVSFKVPKGKTCAFVGASGSGKSTIVSLLERFYNPVSGQILVDGVNLHDIDVNHFRQHVALVAQEPKLFNLTIRENIAYGLDETTVTQVSSGIGVWTVQGGGGL